MSTARPFSSKTPKEKSIPALDLLDESFHRLRTAPPAVLGIYYAGSLPFILGLLYFWADLSHSADAERYGAGAALGLALLFLGMKTCHALFAAQLRDGFNRRPPGTWTPGRVLNLFVVQSALQSIGLFALLTGAFLTIPFGWAYAFCQSATAIGAGERGGVREVLARSARAAVRWPRQNHAMLLIFSLLGLFVWTNIVTAVYTLPRLLKMFTGEENIFTRGGVDLFNSTFVAVTFSLTYLLLDPMVKTFYALRCFYADSVLTGEDLKSELRALPALSAVATGAASGGLAGVDCPRPVATKGAAAAALAAVLFAGFLPVRLQAAPVAGPSAPAPVVASAGADTRIRPPELDKSIEEVMHRREFAWRVPPAARAAAPVESGFMNSVAKWLKDSVIGTLKKIGHAWQTVSDWWKALRRIWFPDDKKVAPESDPASGLFNGDRVILQRMIYALIALIAAVLLFYGWRVWRARLQTPELAGRAAPTGVAAPPDLSNDDVLATQLPEDEWLQLARRLLEAGEHRLALRAFYLSILALLGGRGLLAVARHKSDRDYLLELRRRGRDRADLQLAFTRNVGLYERVWYGPHPANQALFDQFLADRQIIYDASAPPPSLPTPA